MELEGLPPVPVVTIDGPSASGTGTVAQKVAEHLGFHYLDSGALYRLVALDALNREVLLDDEMRLAPLAAELDVVFHGSHILLNGSDVTESIRTEAVGVAASKVSTLRKVRSALLQRQRDFRQAPGLVADGRDMGSVVFPEAQTKIFLTASAEVRAHRRHKQLIDKGIPANLADVLRDIRDRDTRDANRSVAPLQHHADSMLLDTSHMTVADAVAVVVRAYHASHVPRGQ